jgi:hypothetical protein
VVALNRASTAIGLVEQDTNAAVAGFMQRRTQTQMMDWQISV